MNKLVKVISLGTVVGGMLFAAGCKQLEARDQLNRGVAAFRGAAFNEAIEHFQTAIQLDPTLTNAKLYLATAYQQQFIPGAPSADNLHMAQQAVEEYQVVLQEHPDNANALAGIASLYYGMGNLDGARDYYTKSLAVSPNDPTSYYSLGAIAYQQINKPLLAARTAAGVTKPDDPLVGPKATAEVKKTCLGFQQQDKTRIDDGLQNLNKALELKPGYADAMDYINLLYRQRADLACGDVAAREADLKQANDWAAKGLATRKAAVLAADKANQGVAVDTSK